MDCHSRLSPRAAGFAIVALLAAGCAAPIVVTRTVPYASGTPWATSTCKKILCTPESGETPTCDPCGGSGTLPPAGSGRSPTPTEFAGMEFTPPSLLSEQGMLAFSLRTKEYSHLWLWPMGLPNPIRITASDANDRDPAFRPDGRALAFASQKDGFWDLYVLDMESGTIQRLTNSPEYEAHPAWSPDSRQVAFERCINGRLRISILRVEDRALMWPGPDGMESFEPTWSAQARTIAFTGRTEGFTDIYLLNLDTQQILNLTNTPDLDERHPAFSPDGIDLAYSAVENGYSWIYRISTAAAVSTPLLVGQGERPEWSPDGKWLAGVFHPVLEESYLLFSPSNQQVLSPSALRLAGRIGKVAWSAAALSNPLPAWLSALSGNVPEPAATKPPAGTPLSAQLVDLDVNAPDPRLSSAVVQRFQALRAAVKEQSGWDFLGTLDNAVIDINTPMPPKQSLSWLRTGRAFAVSRAAVSKGWLVVLPDPIGASDYWRLYIRAAVQNGTLGEPLRDLPWDFDARTSGTPSAFNNGGQYYPEVPVGYFVDFSQLAAEFGFHRLPSDPEWRTYYFGILYWEFVCDDGLDWFSAMGELYSPYSFLTPTPIDTPTYTPTYYWGPAPTKTRTRTPTPSRTP
ncbi:MAG: PD40 domain-containing protein [Anaerolineales bacterium]|nr:PD40 domain-containing protein [Anaerolineales bacterium]